MDPSRYLFNEIRTYKYDNTTHHILKIELLEE